MAGNLQPLEQKFPLTKNDGTPTEYFIRWAQQRQIDIGNGITAEQAVEIITQYLADHMLQEGSGISLSPSGNISDSPTIAAEVQAILDQITNVQGSILFRGAAGWDDLAAGTAGDFLKTNGAGANPEWDSVGGGGGGMTLLETQTLAADAASISFTSISGAYNDLVVIGTSRSTTAASAINLLIRLNNDSAANYDYEYLQGTAAAAQANGAVGATSIAVGLVVPAASATSASQFGSFEIVLTDYANTNFFRNGYVRSFAKGTNATSAFFLQMAGFLWRNTAAANRIDIIASANNIKAGSTVRLYGRT